MTPSDDALLESKAFELAAMLHRHQRRKGSAIPYVSHLMAVSALVLEDGGNATEAAAALLHDAAEDQGGRPTLALIAVRCGSDVAALVEECSDSLLEIGQKKSPWRERKLAVIEGLPSKSEGALRIMAADKLHNTRATAADLTATGPAVWDRFKTGRDGFLWYHHAMLDGLKTSLPGSRSVAQLAVELQQFG